MQTKLNEFQTTNSEITSIEKSAEIKQICFEMQLKIISTTIATGQCVSQKCIIPNGDKSCQ